MSQCDSCPELVIGSERKESIEILSRIATTIRRQEADDQVHDRKPLASLISVKEEVTSALSTPMKREEEEEKLRCYSHIEARLRPAKTGHSQDFISTDLVGTNELMEMILAFTDHRTLLNARQVSKKICTLIDTSPVLQRQLFLLPDYGSELRVLKSFPNGTTYGCPEAIEITKHGVRMVTRRTEVDVDLHMPFLAFTNKCGATWKRMLITQPPIKFLKVDLGGIGHCAGRQTQELSSDTGITLGQIYDVVETAILAILEHLNERGRNWSFYSEEVAKRYRVRCSARGEEVVFIQAQGE